jgi:hypothetical protein
MNSMKRIAMILALGGSALWLVVPATVAMSCGGGTGGGTGGGSAGTGGGSAGTGGGSAGTGGGSTGTGGGSAGTGGGSAGTGGGSAVADCFSGTPTTNLQFLNACVPSSTEKVLKATVYRDGGVLPTAAEFRTKYPLP